MMQKWLIPHGVLLIEVLCVEEKRFCRCQAGCLQLFNYNLGTQVDHTAHHLSHPLFPRFPTLSPATAILCWSPPWRILELFFPENIAHTPTARGGLHIHRIGTQDPIQATRPVQRKLTGTLLRRTDASADATAPGSFGLNQGSTSQAQCKRVAHRCNSVPCASKYLKGSKMTTIHCELPPSRARGEHGGKWMHLFASFTCSEIFGGFVLCGLGFVFFF